MIHAAQSELSALLTRAAVGRGLAHGIADELTAGTLALCAEGVDATRLALDALTPTPRAPSLSGNTLVGESLPMLAPSAFDLAGTGPLIIATSADITLLRGYAIARGGRWQIGGAFPRYSLRKGGAAPDTPKHAPPFAVAPEVWEGLKTHGLGALVPATPETSAGAGAGAIDND